MELSNFNIPQQFRIICWHRWRCLYIYYWVLWSKCKPSFPQFLLFCCSWKNIFQTLYRLDLLTSLSSSPCFRSFCFPRNNAGKFIPIWSPLIWQRGSLRGDLDRDWLAQQNPSATAESNSCPGPGPESATKPLIQPSLSSDRVILLWLALRTLHYSILSKWKSNHSFIH